MGSGLSDLPRYGVGAEQGPFMESQARDAAYSFANASRPADFNEFMPAELPPLPPETRQDFVTQGQPIPPPTQQAPPQMPGAGQANTQLAQRQMQQGPQPQQQQPQMQTLPPPQRQSLIEQVGANPDADLAMAMARGGFAMAEAAGTPGATFLGALGKGGGVAVAGTLADRAREQKRSLDQEVLGVKRDTARATLARALRKDQPNIQKLLEYRNTLKPGSPEHQSVQAAIDKLGSYSDGPGSIEKLLRTRDQYEVGSEDWNRVNAIINKKGTITDDPTVALVKALTGQTEKSEEEFGKVMGKHNAGIVTAGDTALSTFGTTIRLQGAMDRAIEAGRSSGGFAAGFDKLKAYANSIGEELGFKLPAELRANPDFQMGVAMQKTLVRDILKSKMGSRPSDRDLQFMIETLPNMGFGSEANQLLMDGLYENSIGEVNKSMKLLKYRKEQGKSGGGFSYQEQAAGHEQMLESLLQRMESTSWRPRRDTKLFGYVQDYLKSKAE